MEPKRLLIIIMSVLIAFIIVVALILGVVKFYPTALGLPPIGVDSAAISRVNLEKELMNLPVGVEKEVAKLTLTQFQLDSLNLELMKRNLDSNEKRAIIDNNKSLLDSINKMNSLLMGMKDNVNKTNDTANRKAALSKQLSDSLTKLYNLYLKANNEIAASKEKIKAQEKVNEQKADTLQQKNFATFAKIYNGSEPKEVAKILEQIDEKDAAKILKLMQKKKASKVLDAMKPEVAAAILLLGSGD